MKYAVADHSVNQILDFEGVYFSKIERYDQLTLSNPSGPKSHKSTTHQKYSKGYLGLIHLKKWGGGGVRSGQFFELSPHPSL